VCTCDEIGNRKTLKEGGTNVLGAGLRTTNYFKDVPGTGGALGANALNQYGSIERPQTFDVTGKRAHGSATIKVNGPTALTSGDYQPAGTGLYFRKEVANTPTPWQMNDNYEPVQVTQNDTELTPDQGALQHVGPPTFSPSYDADGNLLADGRWSYTWDGENRLIKMEALEWIQPTSSGSYLAGSSWQATRLEFRYDGFSRRISKKTTRLTGSTVASTAMEGYLYDRWNVVMISQLDPATGNHVARKWSCLWKPDVASLPYARTSWQAAGGVGGLAWLQTGGTQNMSTTYHSYYGQYVLTGNAEIQVPIMDHMGNVRHFIQLKSGTVNQGYGNIGTMIGQVSANLEYDAFGREVRVSSLAVPDTGTPPGLVAGGLYADALPFHFSTKFTDPESGLNYYGYRFYDARDGRWLSRDPIGEQGGVNLYGMVGNGPVNRMDVLGRIGWGPIPGFGLPIPKIDPAPDWHTQRNRKQKGKCPTKEPKGNPAWKDDNSLGECIYHQGHDCYRQPDPGNPGAGFQCCYDDSGDLVRKGKDGAGTYDYHDPAVDKDGHYWSDMAPSQQFGDNFLESQE
jgi:RHS repeat-associated protein